MMDARNREQALELDRDERVDLDQIIERLGFSAEERLQYLLDMLDFEEIARTARRVSSSS
jgi:hypothetical protein